MKLNTRLAIASELVRSAPTAVIATAWIYLLGAPMLPFERVHESFEQLDRYD